MKELPIKSENTDKVPGLKVKFQVKLVAFAAATLSLSLFFEGMRQVGHEPSFEHFLLLIAGTVLTALLIWVQAFWIYVEEKSKGSLTKKVVHFDKLENVFLRRAGSSNKDNEEVTNSEAGVTE
jgi:hypothetical protein